MDKYGRIIHKVALTVISDFICTTLEKRPLPQYKIFHYITYCNVFECFPINYADILFERSGAEEEIAKQFPTERNEYIILRMHL
jgi:hypothetical protein